MTDQKVLVTGGTGFIGRHVVDRFLARGWHVRSFSLPGETGPVDWAQRVDVRYGNVLHAADVVQAADGCNLIIHLAGLVGHSGDYERQWSIFVDGTQKVCEAAADTKARLVVSTSIAVYGEHIQSKLCHERVGHGTWAGAYGRAKQGQEAIALDLAKELGLDLTLIRPANVYGLGGGGAWGDKLLESLTQTGGALIGHADQNNAGLVHVKNLAHAIYLAGTHPSAVGNTYNVCDEEDVSWARFMTDMASLVGKPRPPEYALEDVLALVRANEDPAKLEGPKDSALPFMEGINLVGFDNRFPSDRIRLDLGWEPDVLYAEAISDMRRLHINLP